MKINYNSFVDGNIWYVSFCKKKGFLHLYIGLDEIYKFEIYYVWCKSDSVCLLYLHVFTTFMIHLTGLSIDLQIP